MESESVPPPPSGPARGPSPRLMAVGFGVLGVGLGLGWWLVTRPAEPGPTAAPAPAVRTEPPPPAAPVSVVSAAPLDEGQLAARAEARRARLKAASMALPRGPLLNRTSVVPLDESRGGKATPVGRLLRIDAHRSALGGATTLCLDAPETPLGDVQATCKILDGWPTDQALCSRDDAAKATPLKGPITWRLPCP